MDRLNQKDIDVFREDLITLWNACRWETDNERHELYSAREGLRWVLDELQEYFNAYGSLPAVNLADLQKIEEDDGTSCTT